VKPAAPAQSTEAVANRTPTASLPGVPTMLSDIDQLPTLQVGDYTLQFELGEPTAQGKEVAIKELRETPELACIPPFRTRRSRISDKVQ